MTPVTVRHALGSYPVYVEPGVLARLGDLVERHLRGRRVALVADETVYRLLRAPARRPSRNSRYTVSPA